jgi:hypothetical protein
MASALKKLLSVPSLITLMILLLIPSGALGATFVLTLERAPGAPMEGVKCYAFTEAGSYIGLNGLTDGNGRISFGRNGGCRALHLCDLRNL